MNLKFIKNTLLVALTIFVLINCQTSSQESSSETAEVTKDYIGLNYNALAQKLTEQMFLVEGERVLLVGKPGQFDEMALLLANKITEQGGVFTWVL